VRTSKIFVAPRAQIDRNLRKTEEEGERPGKAKTSKAATKARSKDDGR
jgi:hypothetical protein